jgi:hypothetical protein
MTANNAIHHRHLNVTSMNQALCGLVMASRKAFQGPLLYSPLILSQSPSASQINCQSTNACGGLRRTLKPIASLNSLWKLVEEPFLLLTRCELPTGSST